MEHVFFFLFFEGFGWISISGMYREIRREIVGQVWEEIEKESNI